METVYRCEFVFKGKSLCAYSPAGIEAFKGGFWIDSNYAFSPGSDCLYWVPPHCITYIAKDKRRASA